MVFEYDYEAFICDNHIVKIDWLLYIKEFKL